ncbi:MAG TPA: hypothetical protein EYP28_06010 [Methanophagales archaeon]|nr:hypothetical protein [Methanophagales archaeon]
MKKVFCFVLMPFADEFTFVYELGIKPALDELSKKMDLDPKVERADERLAIKEDKVQEIVKFIKNSDLIIVDITGGNPNVLWELGFCHALKKNVIILAQSGEKIPFNIRTRDVLHYTFSIQGLDDMKKNLSRKLKNIIYEIQRSRSTLRFDEEIENLIYGVQEGLLSIDRDSILKNLAKNEINRLFGRVRGLEKGEFDLRNEKPNLEIIKYFCDYVRQLDTEECEYNTLSTYDFWKEITNEGTDFEYLMANIQAARYGAQIRRVFLIDGRKHPDENVKSDALFQKILEHHYNDTERYRDKIETRVFFSPCYEEDLQTYKNFGIWIKGAERILLRPEYEKGGRMLRTLFIYSNEQKLSVPSFQDNYNEIITYGTHFREIWNKSKKLDTKHFK